MDNICKKCGKCCTDVLIATPYEINDIKKYIKKNNIKPVNRNTTFDKEQKNICPFLSLDNTCLIYPVRLEICRKFFCKNNKFGNCLDSYEYKEVISMMQTFYPKEFMTLNKINLEYEKIRFKNLKNKIYKNNS